MILPDILTRYFDAANRFHSEDAGDCFTSDAIVHDEKADHVGVDAIRAWIVETSRKYRPQLQVTQAKVSGARMLLAVKVSGDFPGSPIELDYDITLRDGKISKLIID